VNEEYERRQQIVEKQKEENLREQLEEDRLREERNARLALVERLRPAWEELPDSERAAIEDEVRQKFPHIAKVPATFERYCIQELARRQSADRVSGQPMERMDE
jgi:hypothetical protein